MTPEAPFLVRVNTAIPNHQYAALAKLAKEHRTTVGELVRELVRRQMAHVPMPERTGEERPRVVVIVRGALTPDQIERIRSLNDQGMADAQIARVTGHNAKTVANYRERLGLPKRSRAGRRKVTTE